MTAFKPWPEEVRYHEENLGELHDAYDCYEKILGPYMDLADWRNGLAIVTGPDGDQMPLDGGIVSLLQSAILAGMIIDSDTKTVGVEFQPDGRYMITADDAYVTVEPIADEFEKALRKHHPLTPVSITVGILAKITAADTLHGLFETEMYDEYDNIREEFTDGWLELKSNQAIEGPSLKQEMLEKAEYLSRYGRIDLRTTKD